MNIEPIFTFFQNVLFYISLLSIEQITLLSILIGFLTFVISKQSEIRMKKYEVREEKYKDFLTLQSDLIQFKIGTDAHDAAKRQKILFDIGSSLLTFGSTRLYKKFLFYRGFQSNPFVLQMIEDIEYRSSLEMYLLGDVLRQVRKELSFENVGRISALQALGFFSDQLIESPVASTKNAEYRYHIRRIKLAHIFHRIFYSLVPIKQLWFFISAVTITPIWLLFHYLLKVPLGAIIKGFKGIFGKK